MRPLDDLGKLIEAFEYPSGFELETPRQEFEQLHTYSFFWWGFALGRENKTNLTHRKHLSRRKSEVLSFEE